MSGPFEQAWLLLKNSNGMPCQTTHGDDQPAMDPLAVALRRARYQGPSPGANLERLPPPGTESIQDMDMMMRQTRGQTPLGKPVPRPIPSMPLGIERPKLAPPYSNPLTGRQYITDQTEALREEQDRKEHEKRLDTDLPYAQQFM